MSAAGGATEGGGLWLHGTLNPYGPNDVQGWGLGVKWGGWGGQHLRTANVGCNNGTT